MSDTISRKGVFIPDITVEMFRNASLESIEDLMASGEMEDILLPSAQPERKTGRWISVTNGRGGHECDLCHNYAPAWQTGEEHLTDFCPYCGAYMREG